MSWLRLLIELNFTADVFRIVNASNGRSGHGVPDSKQRGVG